MVFARTCWLLLSVHCGRHRDRRSIRHSCEGCRSNSDRYFRARLLLHLLPLLENVGRIAQKHFAVRQVLIFLALRKIIYMYILLNQNSNDAPGLTVCDSL